MHTQTYIYAAHERELVDMNGWTTNSKMIVWLYARLCVRDFLAYVHTCAYFISHTYSLLYILFEKYTRKLYSLKITYNWFYWHKRCVINLLIVFMCFSSKLLTFLIFFLFSLSLFFCLLFVFGDLMPIDLAAISKYLNMPSGTWKKRKCQNKWMMWWIINATKNKCSSQSQVCVHIAGHTRQPNDANCQKFKTLFQIN